jgi:hypothetical protein
MLLLLALCAPKAASVSIQSVTIDDKGTPSTSDDKIVIAITTDFGTANYGYIRVYNSFNLNGSAAVINIPLDPTHPGNVGPVPSSFQIDRFDGSSKDRIYSAFTVGFNINPVTVPFSSPPQFVTVFNLAGRDETPFTPKWTKKGHADDAALPIDTNGFGSQYTMMNLDLASLVKTGVPASHVNEYELMSYEGTDYYFSKCYLLGWKVNPDGSCATGVWDSSYFAERFIDSYYNDGIAVFIYLLMYPNRSLDGPGDALKHPNYSGSTMVNGIRSFGLSAFNTSDPAGSRKFRAAVEFLANRFKGKVFGYGVGQEINLHYYWYNRGVLRNSSGVSLDGPSRKAEALDTLLSEYSRTLRVANTAVQKYSKNAKVYTSLTTYWANYWDGAAPPNAWSQFAPSKDFIDVLNSKIKASGDINWGLLYKTFARYGVAGGAPLGGPWNDDVDYKGSYWFWLNNNTAWKACNYNFTGSCDHSSDVSSQPRWVATGDYNTSPFITAKNFKILPDYFKTSALLFKGAPRSIFLGDIGFPSCLYWDNETRCASPGEDPLFDVREDYMAAAVAYLYYKIANLEGIEAWTYYRRIDFGTNVAGVDKLGLGFLDNPPQKTPDLTKFLFNKRKAWDLYAHANRVDWRKYFDKVLYVFSDTQHPTLQLPAYARQDLTSWDAVLEGHPSTGMHFINNALVPTILMPLLLP